MPRPYAKHKQNVQAGRRTGNLEGVKSYSSSTEEAEINTAILSKVRDVYLFTTPPSVPCALI
ncbi:MAG: hypothetical protein OHK0029_34650 [Armatimonadaceae bacterium]